MADNSRAVNVSLLRTDSRRLLLEAATKGEQPHIEKIRYMVHGQACTNASLSRCYQKSYYLSLSRCGQLDCR